MKCSFLGVIQIVAKGRVAISVLIFETQGPAKSVYLNASLDNSPHQYQLTHTVTLRWVILQL